MDKITRLTPIKITLIRNPRTPTLPDQQVPLVLLPSPSVQKALPLNIALLALTHHSPVTMVIIQLTLAMAAPGNSTMKNGTQPEYSKLW